MVNLNPCLSFYNTMRIQQEIEQQLHNTFSPSVLHVFNESNQHNVPAGSESHFRIVVVSEQFIGQSRIKRQRAVNQCLSDILSVIHALAMQTLTPEE